MFQLPFFILHGLKSPGSIPDLILWLDSGDSSTITEDGSGLVSEWRDKSPSANKATAATTARPTYTSSGIDFNGTLHVMTLTSTISSAGEFERFVVCSSDDLTADIFYLGHTSGTSGEGHINTGDFAYRAVDAGSVDLAQSWPGLATEKVLNNINRDSANKVDYIPNGETKVDLFSDQAVVGTENVTTVGSRGAGFYWNGKIHEILMYSRKLTAEERTKITNYLRNKWSF